MLPLKAQQLKNFDWSINVSLNFKLKWF